LACEILESRALLNARLPHPAAVETSTLSATARSSISGSLSGTAAYTASPSNSNVGTDSDNASGNTSMGPGSITGHDQFQSTLMGRNSYHNVYLNGHWTMTLANGSTLTIDYAGNGFSSAATSPYSATIHGLAVGTSGPVYGQFLNFYATMHGNGSTSAVSISFRIQR
jgi:hypothetical protein